MLPCVQARSTLANELLSQPAALPALTSALQPERDIQAAISAMHVLLMSARVSPTLCAMCAESGLLAALLTARRSVNGALALAAAAAIVNGCIRHAARGGGPLGPSAAGCDPQACQAIADMLLVRRDMVLKLIIMEWVGSVFSTINTQPFVHNNQMTLYEYVYVCM